MIVAHIRANGRSLETVRRKEQWEGHEQALITTIWKETRRTEELEEAGYRSPACYSTRAKRWRK